jgi:hypothetical protein
MSRDFLVIRQSDVEYEAYEQAAADRYAKHMAEIHGGEWVVAKKLYYFGDDPDEPDEAA